LINLEIRVQVSRRHIFQASIHGIPGWHIRVIKSHFEDISLEQLATFSKPKSHSCFPRSHFINQLQIKHVFFSPCLQLVFTTPCQYIISLRLMKISVLEFYLQVFPYKKLPQNMRFHNWHRCLHYHQRITWNDIFLHNNLTQLVNFAHGYCVNQSALQYAGSVIDLVTDLVVLLMPMKYLLGELFHRQCFLGR